MNVLNKLSIKNLKLNKKRSISTIVGIILSVALICAVATMCISLKETLVQNTIARSGYWHLKLENVSNEDILTLKNNRDIKDIYETSEIGYSKLAEIKNEDKPYLKVYSMDENVFNNLKFHLVEGRFPKNENEIIISSHLKSNGEVDKKIGDKIKLNIGKRMTLDNCKLYSSNSYIKDNEKIDDAKEFEFTIVGIIERPNYDFEKHGEAAYTAITTNIEKDKNNIYISLKNPKEYKTSIAQILGIKDYSEIEKNLTKLKYENFEENSELLRWEVLSVSQTSMNMINSVVGVVILIIIFTSVFCIRNSFAISTTEKVKMYGMLASVGTTKKQIRKNVIFEAFALGLIGIPVGIVAGIFAVFILIKIINVLVGNFLFYDGAGMVFKTSIFPIVISVFLGIITIYLSAIASAKRASKVTPIESLRSSNEIKIQSKKLKTPKIIKKIFGMGGVIAYKNLKRSKKKYRTTVISLAVSICIFITMNAFLTNMFGMTERYYKDYEYNIRIMSRDTISEEEYREISKLENIEEKFTIYNMPQISSIEITDMSKVNVTKKDDSINGKNGVSDTAEKYYLNVVAFDSKTFEKYAKKLGMNLDKTKKQGILYDVDMEFDENGKEKEIRTCKYNKGDIIEGKLYHNKKDVNIKIAEVTNKAPYGFENSYSNSGYLFLNVDDFKEFDFEITGILIQSNNASQFEEDFLKGHKKLTCDNRDRMMKEEKSMNLVISIFLYGFITVITLIGVTNIFNTITSNIELRQKEFAMLKSIGMTKKEFNKMVNLETIFYSIKSLIYGIILGLLGTFALYKSFSVKIDSGMYIPIKPIIISIVAVFILVFIIMKYSVNKINKQNTIETIRKENI